MSIQATANSVNVSTISELLDTIARLEEENAIQKRIICKHSSDLKTLQRADSFSERLESNPHISALCKIIWKKLQHVLSTFDADEQGRTWVDMGFLAKLAGCSAKQAGKTVQYCHEHLAIIRRYEVKDAKKHKRILIKPTALTWTAEPDKVKPDTPNMHGGSPDRKRLPCECGCTKRKVTRNRREECAACGELLHDSGDVVEFFDNTSGKPKKIPMDKMSHKGTSNNPPPVSLLSDAEMSEKSEKLGENGENLAKFAKISEPLDILSSDEFLASFLAKRIGAGQTIYSTGDIEEVKKKKYYTHGSGYPLDILSYIAGNIHHIYGSPLRLADGSTNVLAWDIDVKDTTHYAKRHIDMTQLAEAGAVPVCWLRRDGSCHLELYFDEPVNVDVAYAWACSVAPGLKDIEECYPINQKHNGRISWPLWHRVKTFSPDKKMLSDEVFACQAEFMFPGDDEIIKHPGIAEDKDGLAALLSKAITLTLLIPNLEVMEQIAPQTRHTGGGLLDKPSPIRRPGQYDDGLRAPALQWFYDTHSWEDVTGGILQHNRFSSPFREDSTPSVTINANGFTASDFQPGGVVVCKDKFGWWVAFNGLDNNEELKKLIAEYRKRCQEQEQVAS